LLVDYLLGIQQRWEIGIGYEAILLFKALLE
jgi:hypothetical protein